LLRQYGLEPGITSIFIRKETLEDIFLKLLKEQENHG